MSDSEMLTKSSSVQNDQAKFISRTEQELNIRKSIAIH